MAGTKLKTHRVPHNKKGYESGPVKKLRRSMRNKNPRAHAEVVKKIKSEYSKPTRSNPREPRGYYD
jgi:hypothetical protein